MTASNARKALFVGALAVCATALTRSAISYRLWLRKEMQRVRAESSIIDTAEGPIEYRRMGAGPAVLIVHGSPGGYDQSIAFARLLDIQGARNANRSHAEQIGYTYIAISRPGYLRTPLANRKTPEAQADLYAALLDALGIQQASIIGISGGGPSSLQFALRHPERCRSLVMISGVAQHYSEQAVKRAAPTWQRPFRQILEQLTTFDPLLYALLLLLRLFRGSAVTIDLLRSVALYRLRKNGYKNDLRQFEAIACYPLEQITIPTFVVHGTSDDEVPFEHAKELERTIPRVTLLAVEGGGHMSFYTHARTVMPLLYDFLAP